MEIGTYIRAFDFNTTDSCYMEGKIIAVDDDSKTLTVKTTDVVFGDEHKEFGEVLGNDTFTTPMLGYAYSDGRTRFNQDKGESRFKSRIIVLG